MAAEEVDSTPPKEEGAYIFGMFVSGARYDMNNRVLEESLPKKMFSIVPVICCKAYVYNPLKIDKNYY